MPPQSATSDVSQHLQNIDERIRDMQQRQDLYMATMTAFHGELLTVIKKSATDAECPNGKLNLS